MLHAVLAVYRLTTHSGEPIDTVDMYPSDVCLCVPQKVSFPSSRLYFPVTSTHAFYECSSSNTCFRVLCTAGPLGLPERPSLGFYCTTAGMEFEI